MDNNLTDCAILDHFGLVRLSTENCWYIIRTSLGMKEPNATKALMKTDSAPRAEIIDIDVSGIMEILPFDPRPKICK